MKKRTIIMTLAALVVCASLWIGRAAKQAHNGWVTLNVSRAPLGKVVRKIERQTWERVPVDKALKDVKVTLAVRNMPLADVLDLLCDQAGARWSENFAVYKSGRALGRLRAFLEGEASLEIAGWTNITPGFGGAGLNNQGAHGNGHSGSDASHTAAMQSLPDGSTKMATVGQDGQVKVTRTFPDGTSQEINPNAEPGLVRKLRESGTGGVMGDGWSPVQLMLETRLLAGLGDAAPRQASPDSARQAARRIRGKWAAYYALQPSPWRGLIRAQRFLSAKSPGDSKPSPGNAGLAPSASVKDPARIQQEIIRQAMNTEFRLTPEQQVQRARQRRTMRESMSGAHGEQH